MLSWIRLSWNDSTVSVMVKTEGQLYCWVCVSIVTGPRALTVLGRDVTLEKTCGSIADCTFDELCGRVSVCLK